MPPKKVYSLCFIHPLTKRQQCISNEAVSNYLADGSEKKKLRPHPQLTFSKCTSKQQRTGYAEKKS